MSKHDETHADVMTTMRNGNAQPEFYQRLLNEFADRAEAAHSRETASLLAEIELLRGLAETGQAAIDVIADLCGVSPAKLAGEVITELAGGDKEDTTK